MNEVVKASDLRPVSFEHRDGRYWLQTKLIVDLLKKGIEESRVISRDDITDCYMDFVFRNTEIIEKYEHRYNKALDKYGYYKVPYTREDYKKRWDTRGKARDWFTKNLGSAILRGKILAIPIIEAE